VWQRLFRKGQATPEDELAAMRPYTYARSTPEQVIEEDNLVRLADYPTLRGYQAQLCGLMVWSSYYQLPRLRCPTLLLHGTQDRLIPPQNARVLAQRIGGARLVEIDAASHWLHSDQTARVAGEVQAFTAKHRASDAAA
jgi:3-oxoadipate enol-lactonase